MPFVFRQVVGFDRYYLRLVRMTAECQSQWRRDRLEKHRRVREQNEGDGRMEGL
jgi:hypothetical protein